MDVYFPYEFSSFVQFQGKILNRLNYSAVKNNCKAIHNIVIGIRIKRFTQR